MLRKWTLENVHKFLKNVRALKHFCLFSVRKVQKLLFSHFWLIENLLVSSLAVQNI
jgi:hypothetical protein